MIIFYLFIGRGGKEKDTGRNRQRLVALLVSRTGASTAPKKEAAYFSVSPYCTGNCSDQKCGLKNCKGAEWAEPRGEEEGEEEGPTGILLPTHGCTLPQKPVQLSAYYYPVGSVLKCKLPEQGEEASSCGLPTCSQAFLMLCLES